ncbi:hypothetical protein M0R72_17625 [Candidatus Pacearchaeota archaeon]|jgi:hypothetical protein|nr:hypothetical protein [Candidatus Pacearchaeota archaeon]
MSGRRVKWCNRFVAENATTAPWTFYAMVQSLRCKPHVKVRLLKLHGKLQEGAA